jgi:hypothetical protein
MGRGTLQRRGRTLAGARVVDAVAFMTSDLDAVAADDAAITATHRQGA